MQTNNQLVLSLLQPSGHTFNNEIRISQILSKFTLRKINEKTYQMKTSFKKKKKQTKPVQLLFLVHIAQRSFFLPPVKSMK